jgi:hypothetical protein
MSSPVQKLEKQNAANDENKLDEMTALSFF